MRQATITRILPLAVVLLAATPASEAAAQQLAQRITDIADGRARFVFSARPGVCGDGQNLITRDDCTVRSQRMNDGGRWRSEGPVRVTLTIRDRRVVSLRTAVGGDTTLPDGVTDLGRVSTPEATDYLLLLAERGEGRVGDDAVVPAALADSVTVWPRLLALARNERLPRNTRQSAALWLGFAAADAIAPDVEGTSEEHDARAQAVFALSQLPRDEGVPALVQVARTHRDPAIRRKAVFWLSQTLDERAFDAMEAILKGL